MKKYLMSGIAAIAISVAFTSCGNDEIVPMSQTELDKAKYDAAFLAYVGGSIAPNQDWGFGGYTRSANVTRALPTFPTFKDNDCPSMPAYSNTVPSDAIYAKTYAEEHPDDKYPEGATIYIDNDYPQFGGGNQVGNVQNLTIYIDGNITYDYGFNQNDKGTTLCVTENSTLKLKQISERLTIYLAPNATLDLSECEADIYNPVTYQTSKVSGAAFTQAGAGLYMSSGSTVSGGTLYFKDGYTVLNEGGTIDVAELHVENGAVLFNKKDIKATGVIALRNTNGEIDNFGKMEGASMTLDANARFYNVAGGEVTISGLTKLNNDSGNNAWMNDGKFNTGSFEITGGCQDPAAFNNCNMKVEGQFFMNHGNFVLDGGAAVECATFKWVSDNYFHMGSKALLKVSGEMLMDNQNNSPAYGFYGDGNEYAVIKAGSIAKASDGKHRAAYYGNLFIDTDSHFPQTIIADGPYYYFANSVKFSFTDSNEGGAQKATDFSISIAADEKGCTPGYTYTNEKSADIRIIAEDLSASTGSDFDFNDVVLDVTFGSPAKIVLVAAGGTLPLRINGNDALEVHKLYGVWQGTDVIEENKMTQKMVSVGGDITPFNVDITSQVNVNIANAAEANTKLKLEVYKNGSWEEMEAPRGEPAAKLAVDPTYTILSERTSIKNTYPLFLDWATQENFTSKWW